MGEFKWEELGLNYELKDTETPEPELVDKVREILKLSGKKVL